MENFKLEVDRLRAVLRRATPSIVGMESMKHIMVYLVHRYMTLRRCKQFGVPKRFSWEKMLLLAKVSGWEASRLYFEKGEDGTLMGCFDPYFIKGFVFRIDKAEIHEELIRIVVRVDLAELRFDVDLLGFLYEQQLAIGGSASKDLGQFFTERSAIRYMVRLCNPQVVNGVPESVCDPATGSAGFLTAVIRYYADNYGEIDWAKFQNQIHGCDTEPFVTALAKVNLFIESHGTAFKEVKIRNSLTEDLLLEGYDVILANMPFGLRGLKYEECSQRIKSLGIKGSKSEPLFLQLMMLSLKMGGRCCVIVPNGFLTNLSKLEVKTRKCLLENFELEKVIKKKGKFFTNTGVVSSILFFKRTGNPTTKITFCELEKFEDGTTDERELLTIKMNELDQETFSFDPNRYRQSIVEPEVVFENQKLAQLATPENGKPLTAEQKTEGGIYPLLGGGMEYQGTYNRFNCEGGTITISKGGSAGRVLWHDGPFWAGSHCMVLVPKDIILKKFLYYSLVRKQEEILNHFIVGGVITHCRWQELERVEFPVPPLEIQEKIVDGLDAITEAPKRAKELIWILKKQGRAIVQSIRGQRLPLGEFYNLLSVKEFNFKDLDYVGEYDFYSGSSKNPIGKHSSYSYDGVDYLLLVNVGGKNHGEDSASLGKVYRVSGKVAVTSSNFVLEPKTKELHSYLYQYLKYSKKEIADLAIVTTITLEKINRKPMLEFKVWIPPPEEMKEITDSLEEIENEIKSLEEIENQSEKKSKMYFNSWLKNDS